MSISMQGGGRARADAVRFSSLCSRCRHGPLGKCVHCVPLEVRVHAEGVPRAVSIPLSPWAGLEWFKELIYLLPWASYSP